MIEQPRGEHSAKPEAVFELIEAYFPHLPKIELFRRGPARPNWSAWGNEAEPLKAGTAIRAAKPAQPAPPPADDGVDVDGAGFLRRQAS